MPATVPASGVSRFTLVRVFLRSLLLQAGFSTRLMQGLGAAYALYPALKRLYPEGPARTEAVRRHVVLFNTHPVFAAAILGALVRMEQRAAAGELPTQQVIALRSAFTSPLAAIGDGFFWDAVRPVSALVAVLLAPFIGVWSVLVFLGLYNVVHLGLRIWLFRTGYREAEGLIGSIRRLQFPVRTDRLRKGAAALAGAVGATVILQAGFGPWGGVRPVPALLAGGALLVSVLLSPRVPPLILALSALALGLLGSLFF